MRILRAGIIGCGNISVTHISALEKTENAKITAVCDLRADRRAAAAKRTGAKEYENWQDLIADPEVDVVHLCVPHDLHAPFAIAALNAGKNVLSEKPMAICEEDARAMIAASEKEGAGTLGVIFQNRYNDAVVKAKSIIDSGEAGAFLGARLDVSWHREGPYYTESGWRGIKKREGAGSLINQSIHTLDLASYLCGPIAKVRAAIFTGLLEGVIDVEDNVSAVAVYESGQPLTIHTTNNYVTDAPVMLEMQFEKCALRLEGAELYRVQNGVTELLEDGRSAPAVEGKSYWGTSHGRQIADYYRAVAEGRHFWLDGREGFPALSLVKAIQRSSDEARWVDLEKA